MIRMVPDKFKHAYELSHELLNMVKQERWDEFVESAEYYVSVVQDAIDHEFHKTLAGENENLHMMVGSLIENEAEITKILKARLHVLGENITRLQQGKRCSLAYGSQSFTYLN